SGTADGSPWSQRKWYVWWDAAIFFFQAEDGIRDKLVTGVQTCALPISDGVGDAGGVRHRRRERLGRARYHAHEHVVVGAVEAALELHDLVALAIGARHAEREERRLAAAGRVAHLLGARHGGHDLLGKPDGRLVDHEVGGPALHLPLHRLHHRGVRVAEQHGTGAEQIVEVAAARHVEQVGATALADDELETGTRPMAAEDAAGQDARGVLEKIALITHAKTILAEGATGYQTRRPVIPPRA